MITNTVDIAGLDGRPVPLTPAQLSELHKQVRGPMLQAGDEGWDAATRIWNGLITRTPALVIQVSSPQDVAAAVRFAANRGLLLGIKGCGHNIGGTAIADGGLVLDMSRMNDISVDPQAKLATVGPGCRLQDVDRATQVHGLATVLGFISDVGVTGLEIGVLHLAGALNARDADDGAVGNRQARFVIGVKGMWDASERSPSALQQWIRAAWERVRPFSTGATDINFQTEDEDDTRIRATYGANYPRLVEIKKKYDPRNVFRVNRNIGVG